MDRINASVIKKIVIYIEFTERSSTNRWKTLFVKRTSSRQNILAPRYIYYKIPCWKEMLSFRKLFHKAVGTEATII